MQNIYSIMSIFSTFLTIAGIIGGALAFKSGINRSAYEIQERVINAMQQEVSILRERLADLEAENKRLDNVIFAVSETLKKRGLVVMIEGSLVTVSDGHETQTVHIQEGFSDGNNRS